MNDYSLTIFKSIFDTKTNRRMDFQTWESLEQLLYDLSKRPGYKPKKDEKFVKHASPLISPATYIEGSRRKNDNVVSWAGWACLDVDKYDGSFEETICKFKTHYFVCYSTASSTVEHPKFRLVFPLSRHVKADEIRHFWFALNIEMLSVGDAQTKDLSRMYYVPAQYPNAHNFIFTNKGTVLDVDSLLSRHHYVAKTSKNLFDLIPEALRQAMIKEKESQLTNSNISWTSYRDCPFVSKKQVAEYQLITDTGWYHKMYTIMCAIALRALKKNYPITVEQIAHLCREIDADTGGWYKKRNFEEESARALAYAFTKNYSIH
jgi:hypothetical protein